MWNQKPSFRFEIAHFSAREHVVTSQTFVSGGCEWYLSVHPKRDIYIDDRVSLYLNVANHQSLRTGWKRNAKYYFLMLNQSDKEIYRSAVRKANTLFCAENPAWGFRKTLPISKLQEKGFLENDILIIEVYVNVAEAIDGEGEEVFVSNETAYINGFEVFPQQVSSVRKIFEEHPDIANDIKPKNQAVKTAYMNILLNLVNKFQNPPKNISETKLRKACNELSELMEVGFKLDWLKLKLDEVSLVEKKPVADESRVQKLEERVKNLETTAEDSSFKMDWMNLKFERKKPSADESRVQKLEGHLKNLEVMESGFKKLWVKSKLEEKKPVADESRVQELEERLKNLEVMESSFKMECLESKLEKLSLERKKADADGYRVQELEERVKNLEVIESGSKLDTLKTKLDEVTLERKKSDYADWFRFQILEERFNNLEWLVEMGFNLDSLEKVSMEGNTSNDSHECQAKQLEERVKILELIETGSKLDCLNSKLDEIYDADVSRAQQLEERITMTECFLAKVYLEGKKSDDADESRAQQLEERIRMTECFLAKVYLEGKKSDDADKSRVQQLEESVKNLELMVSSLKVELDKKKNKSCADGFLLVDDVA